MEEEKRTYQIEIELLSKLRLRSNLDEKQEAEHHTWSARHQDKKILSEELIVELIKKIEAL